LRIAFEWTNIHTYWLDSDPISCSIVKLPRQPEP